ncbi:MAG: TIGR00725 family protein, partial [Halanaerobium sp.]
GTLSEMALALKHGISVVSLKSWALDEISLDPDIDQLFFPVETAEEAVEKACELAEKRQRLKEIRE